MAPEDIQCNTDRVHAVRDNDKHVCVSEQTAEKRGWEVIPKPVVENPPVVENTSVVENTDSVAISEQIQVNKSNTDSGLKTIPNPTGYWTPIIEKDQRDEFVDKILQITGHNLLEDYDRRGDRIYYTDAGYVLPFCQGGNECNKERIKFSNYKTIEGKFPFPDVHYRFYIMDGELDEKYLDAYVKDFAQRMDWEYTDDQLHKNIGKTIRYTFKSEYGHIIFHFDYYHGGLVVWFGYGGWTNNPELVPKEFPLSYDDAISKVQQYVTDIDEMHVSHDQFEKPENRIPHMACEFEFLDKPYVKERIEIIAGVPYYNVDVGKCSYRDHTGMAHAAILLIDAWQGQDIIHAHVKGLD